MASLRPQMTGSTGPGTLRVLGHLLAAPFSAVTASLAGARRRVGTRLIAPLPGSVWLSGAFLAGGIVLGALISTGWQARSAGALSASAPVTRQSDREIVVATIGRLETEQADLKKQIADLRTQLSSVQGNDAKRKTTLLDINNEIARQRLASGLAAVRGAGVVASFDDSTARSIPENEDPANYILHEYDLRDVLNALWIAGAEAISVNGERIVSSTSLYCVGTTIGDPQALAAALQGSPQMEKFNQRARIYDLPIKVDQGQDVLVPAYNGSFVYKYASVQGQE
jgi:uncharacterized protein YlxW (UPF0749 family)